MNVLYEGLKQNSTIVLVPSTAVESICSATAARNRAAGEHNRIGAERESEVEIRARRS